ncbi:MAG: cellulase family glycosylhydrolase [Verrucomicrobiota bacterium]
MPSAPSLPPAVRTKTASARMRAASHLTTGFAALAFFLGIKSLPAEAAQPGLSVGTGGGLLLEGKPWRGLGVNYYDAFARLLGDGKIADAEAGFRALAAEKIPFIRFAACGYWPVDWKLYQADREEYFRRFDALVKLAEKHGIGLIPSLFWHQPTISDLVGEPIQEWGNPASGTTAFMRGYTREVVLRHRDSKAVWAWEFGNEFNLPADLPNAAEHRAPVIPALGTAAGRSELDDLRHADFRSALAEFAKEVRLHDPRRLIISGNAFPRPSAWHQMRSRTWEKDSPEQWATMLDGDNPAPLPSYSGRLYSAGDLEFLPRAAAQSAKDNKPLIIGEFGVSGVLTDESSQQFRTQLEALDQNRIPLAALWVFDFKGQDADWNVTSVNARAGQLRLTAEMNARWQSTDAAARTP